MLYQILAEDRAPRVREEAIPLQAVTYFHTVIRKFCLLDKEFTGSRDTAIKVFHIVCA